MASEYSFAGFGCGELVLSCFEGLRFQLRLGLLFCLGGILLLRFLVCWSRVFVYLPGSDLARPAGWNSICIGVNEVWLVPLLLVLLMSPFQRRGFCPSVGLCFLGVVGFCLLVVASSGASTPFSLESPWGWCVYYLLLVLR